MKGDVGEKVRWENYIWGEEGKLGPMEDKEAGVQWKKLHADV